MADIDYFAPHLLQSFSVRPVPIDQYAYLPDPHPLTNPTRSSHSHPFLARPLFAPLLFPNDTSDARDHCANERTFLSWLRLSIYMAVVSVAIMISFHLKSQPTALERRLAGPAGLIFWALSLACLASGCANYVKTVTKYSRRAALVQTGWKTQIVSVYLCTLDSFDDVMASCMCFTDFCLLLGVYCGGLCHCRSLCAFIIYECSKEINE